MGRRSLLASWVALLCVLAACAAPPPPTATAPPPTAAPPAPTTAGPTTVSGAIDKVDGRALTITTPNGARLVQVAEGARIEQEGRGSLADLKPGLSVGVTGKPDGTALSIRIFPAAFGTPRPGQFPMAGANQGNLMTNSVIQMFDGKTLTVDAGAARHQITVAPDTEVLKPVPATLADLQTGKRVLAAGAPGPDGSLVAATVNILGAPPQLAP